MLKPKKNNTISRQKFFIRRNLRGFTLVELLVVLIIISLISGVILVSLRGIKEKARIAKGLEFSQTVQNVIGAYAVGVWSFEKIESGKVLDGSGYGNDGKLLPIASPPTLVEGIIGNGLEFNGVDNRVDVENDVSLDITDTITVEVWIKPYELPSRDFYIVTKLDYDNRKGFWFHGWSKDLKIGIADGSSWYVYMEPNILTVNEWQHLAVTFGTGLNVIFYKNSISYNKGSAPTMDPATDESFTISTKRTGRTFPNGIIDEVRIYRRALTTAEIQKHYVEGLKKYKLVEK